MERNFNLRQTKQRVANDRRMAARMVARDIIRARDTLRAREDARLLKHGASATAEARNYRYLKHSDPLFQGLNADAMDKVLAGQVNFWVSRRKNANGFSHDGSSNNPKPFDVLAFLLHMLKRGKLSEAAMVKLVRTIQHKMTLHHRPSAPRLGEDPKETDRIVTKTLVFAFADIDKYPSCVR